MNVQEVGEFVKTNRADLRKLVSRGQTDGAVRYTEEGVRYENGMRDGVPYRSNRDLARYATNEL